MILPVKARDRMYTVSLENGLLDKAGEIFDLQRKVLIVTDRGVPAEIVKTVAAQCKSPFIVICPAGEKTKSLEKFSGLLKTMLENGFSRSDCVVAVGGGVIGDLAGFAAASYMRGIDFYNIPTTLLSMVDSSVGGKTAVNIAGVKNICGAFYPPMGVLIDPLLLKTLPRRQLSAGMAEIIKVAMTSDAKLLSRLEKEDPDYPVLIENAILIKAAVVEEDETEQGMRKILNFGHTLGHAVESVSAGKLLHGEAVAIGMLPMCGVAARRRLLPILLKYDLPVSCNLDGEKIFEVLLHDKKSAPGGKISIVTVKTPGQAVIKEVAALSLKKKIELLKGEEHHE